MYEEVIWNVYHSRQCSARLKMDRNSMELDYWWARLFSQQLLLSCSISDQCLYIKVSFKSHLNFAAYLELTPGASLLMVMTSQLRFLPIYTICTLSISNLDLLLFLLNFLLYIISIRSWFIEKTHRLRRWVLFAKSSGERVLLLTGTEDSGLQIIREKDWNVKKQMEQNVKC